MLDVTTYDDYHILDQRFFIPDFRTMDAAPCITTSVTHEDFLAFEDMHPIDIDVFTDSAISQRNLLESYHRFYRIVNKSVLVGRDSEDYLAQKELGPFEKWIENNALSGTLTNELEKQLKTVWKRAERLNELESIVQSFDRYKAELTQRYKEAMDETSNKCVMHELMPRRSQRTTMDMNCHQWSHIATKLDELLQNQQRLEEQITKSRAVSVDMTAAIEMSKNHEVFVDAVIHENEKQITKVENILAEMHEDAEKCTFLSSTSNTSAVDFQEQDFEHSFSESVKQDDGPTAEEDDLFKEEFVQDIFKVQKNILISALNNCRSDDSSPEHSSQQQQHRSHRRCNDLTFSFSSIPDLHLNDCEQLTSLIT